MSETARGNILETLQQIRGGDMLYDMTAEIEKVIAAVREYGKKGSLTLKLEISPLNGRDGNSVQIVDEVKSSLPKADAKKTIFFTDDTNQLRRDDPRQLKFNFVDKPAKEGDKK